MLVLIALGQVDAIAIMPDVLIDAAWSLGLPAFLPWPALGRLALALAGGMALGGAIVAGRMWLGKSPGWIAYQSAAAARRHSDMPAAALLALSAGVSEELFFRLLLPLLVGLVTSSGLTGLAVGFVAFTLLHKHQGWAGMLLVALVGMALTYLYLLTGRLWVAMVVHTFIDLNAFVLRPWLTRFSSSAASRS